MFADRRDAHAVAVFVEVKVDPDSIPGIGQVGAYVEAPKVRKSDDAAIAGEAHGRGDVVRQLVAVPVHNVVHLHTHANATNRSASHSRVPATLL